MSEIHKQTWAIMHRGSFWHWDEVTSAFRGKCVQMLCITIV